ncbi:hypothetical protein D3C74_356480 [compost metagenome]
MLSQVDEYRGRGQADAIEYRARARIGQDDQAQTRLLEPAGARHLEGMGSLFAARAGDIVCFAVQVYADVRNKYCLQGFQHFQRVCGQPLGRLEAFREAVYVAGLCPSV